MTLTLEEARAILGDVKLTDKEIERLILSLSAIASNVLDDLLQEGMVHEQQ